MEYTIIIILIALLQYIYFTMRVGLSRNKFSVSSPAMSGNDDWECISRVQQNTMEQLIVFIPGMLAFQMYVSQQWVLIPGVVFIVGRQLYSHLYLKDPKSRGPGMMLTLLSNITLVVGSLIGIAMSMLG